MSGSRSFEEIFRHDAFVRALARRLVADAAAADDVAQQTWLVAWRTPPDDRGPLRHWLACTVRGAAANVRRSLDRRRRRERAAARAEASTPERVAEREEARRRLHDAVRALDEPYRTAVLLRYFEGRSVRDIATEANEPSETVRTRLKRAQTRLREALTRESDGERPWWATLLPLAGWRPDAFAAAATAATTTAALTGGATMSVKAAVTGGIAALVAAGIVFQIARPSIDGDRPAAPISPADRSDRSADATKPSAGVSDPKPGTATTFVDDDGSSGAVLDPAVGVVVFGAVTDETGRGVEKMSVVLQREEDGFYREASTDADGAYAMTHLAPGLWTARIWDAPGYSPVEKEVLVGTAAEQTVDFSLRARKRLAVKVRTPDGKPFEETLDGANKDLALITLRAVATVSPPPSAFPKTASVALWGCGIGAFRQAPRDAMTPSPPSDLIGWLELDAPPPFHVALTNRTAVLTSKLVEGPADEVVFELDPADHLRSFGAVRMRLIDAATDVPIEGLAVNCRTAQGYGGHVKTGADGRADFTGLPPGIVFVHPAHHFGKYERFFFEAHVSSGGVVECGDLRLDAKTAIEGRIEWAEPPTGNRSVSYAPFRWMSDDREIQDYSSYSLDAAGAFSIQDAGRGRQLLQVCAGDSRMGTRALYSTIVDTSGGEVKGLIVRVPLLFRATIDVQDVGAGVVVRIVDANGALVHAFRPVKASYRFRLAAGEYRCRVVSDGGGARDIPFIVGVASTRITVR
jgi:RNA polymerase sigma factor (sigma-70 family)